MAVPRASAAAHPVAEGKNDSVKGRTVTRTDLAFRWDGHRRGQRSKAKGKKTSAAANATGGFNHGWKGRSRLRKLWQAGGAITLPDKATATPRLSPFQSFGDGA